MMNYGYESKNESFIVDIDQLNEKALGSGKQIKGWQI